MPKKPREYDSQKNMIPFRQEGLTSLAEEDIREVDRSMIEDLGIELMKV
ncbi:hypothetical protein [Methanocrinis sp.]